MTIDSTVSTAQTVLARAAFAQAITALRMAHTQFAAAELSPVAHSHAREAALAHALQNLAATYGVMLEAPLQIDSRGEFSIVSRPEGSVRGMGTSPFGEFAEVLNKHRPRTGVLPGTLDPSNGWCLMNHFDVERMVVEHSAALQS